MEILTEIFSDTLILQKLKFNPAVLSFSIEEDDPTKRYVKIMRRLAQENQSLPCIILSDYTGDFDGGQVGAGPCHTWIDSEGKKFLAYLSTSKGGKVAIDILSTDPDSRDLLTDSLVSSLLLFLRDLDYTITKQYDNGYFVVVIDSKFNFTPGPDQPRPQDLTEKICSAKLSLGITYEEYIYVDAVESRVYQDIEEVSGNPFTYSTDPNEFGLSTYSGTSLRVGGHFPLRMKGSGFYQYTSSNLDVLDVDNRGVVHAKLPGEAIISVRDVMNQTTVEIEFTVNLS